MMNFPEIELALRRSPLFQELFALVETGDFSSLESDAKRQHFIPQFLLHGFATPSDDERIFQLNTGSGANRRVRIDEAASRRWFYAIRDEGGNRSNQIEGFLAMVERHAAPALARFLADPRDLSEPDRGTLSFFFALLDQRTPGATSRTKQTGDVVMRMMFLTEFSDAEMFKTRYRQMEEARELERRLGDDEIEELRLRMIEDLKEGRVGFADPQAEALRMGITVAAQQCYLIYGMQWSLLRSEGRFFTSDRGLAIHDPKPLHPWSSQAILSSEAAETTIPLDASNCLLLQLGDEQLTLVEAGNDRADEINLRTYGWADSYIFGHSQELLASTRRLARQQPARVVRPVPHHHVILMDADPSDTSLADYNQSRGRPAYLRVRGVPHDYVVFHHDQDPMRQITMMNERVRERARVAFGVAHGEDVPGGAAIEVVGLGDIGGNEGITADIQREWGEFKEWAEAQQEAQPGE